MRERENESPRSSDLSLSLLQDERPRAWRGSKDVPFSVAAKLELASKDTCSGTSLNAGPGHLLLVLGLVLIAGLFPLSQRIAIHPASDGVPPIFDARGFV